MKPKQFFLRTTNSASRHPVLLFTNIPVKYTDEQFYSRLNDGEKGATQRERPSVALECFFHDRFHRLAIALLSDRSHFIPRSNTDERFRPLVRSQIDARPCLKLLFV